MMRTGTRYALAALLILVPLSFALSIDAREIIENVQEQYDDLKDVTISFQQSVRFRVSRGEQSVKGSLYFKKPNKYRIETDERTVVTDGKTSWSYNQKNRQVVIDTYKPDAHGLSPERLLLQYPKEYYSTLVGEEQVGKLKCYVLKLTPKEDNSFATALKIWVSKDWYIRKVEVTDINGAVTTYVIDALAVDQKLPDSRFEFQIPDKSEIIDLR
jgi:chaperone LolA